MILVTGGSGFLGAHLLAELVRQGKPVVAVKRPTTRLDYAKKVFELAGIKEKFGEVTWKDVDLLDVYAVEEALEGVEEVYHSASQVSFDPADHAAMLNNNVKITANLVNAALQTGVKKFMHVSSVAALGRSAQEEIIDETRIWKTDPVNTQYGLSKYQSEMEVWRGFEEGLPVIVVNPSMILGYCRWDEGTGKMFDRAWQGMKHYMHGITGWVDVKDVVACMLLLMEKEKNTIGERYILISENCTYKDVFTMMAHALHKPAPSVPASTSAMNLMLQAEKLRTFFTRKSPMITKETLRNASLHCTYVNDKILKEIPFVFKPVKQTIDEVALLYLSEKENVPV